ncbi:MAG TPA: hypothetical protein PKW95_13695 [bacterium]|nr:hypothetical protein [bacterium]
MKKILYLLVISFLLMCFVFSACGDDDDDDNDDSNAADDDDDADDDDTDDDDTDGDDDGDWKKILVEPDMGYNTQIPSIAVDSQNAAHMVYMVASEDLDYDIYYAHMNGEEAVTERIDQLISPYSPSMVVDDQDFVHLCYHNSLTNKLTYVTNKTGEWVSEDVNDDLAYSERYDIAVDGNGAVYILYGDRLGGLYSIALATNKDGDWQREVIWQQGPDNDYAVGLTPRIAFDAQDNIHISFNAATSANGDVALYYLHQDGDQWIEEQVLFDNMSLTTIDMKVESDGTVHMSCVRNEGGVYFLKYICGTAGNWQIDYVPISDSEDLVDQDFHSSYYAMDIDQTGQPHFAIKVYSEADEDYQLLYLYRKNGEWSREVLYIVNADNWTDLALDTNDKAHIALMADDEVNNTDSSMLWYITNAL